MVTRLAPAVQKKPAELFSLAVSEKPQALLLCRGEYERAARVRGGERSLVAGALNEARGSTSYSSSPASALPPGFLASPSWRSCPQPRAPS